MNLDAIPGNEPADLADNRRGVISPMQAELARTRIRRARGIVLLSLGAGALACIATVIVTASRTGQWGAAIGGTIGGAAFAGIMYLVLVKFLFAPWAKMMEQGQVEPVEGTVENLFVPYQTGRGFFIRVAGQRYLGPDGRVGRALHIGERVRLYVIPGRRNLVAIERL